MFKRNTLSLAILASLASITVQAADGDTQNKEDSGAATTVADYRAYAGRGAVCNVMNVRRGPSGKS